MDNENTTSETNDTYMTEMMKGALSKSVASAAAVLTTLLVTAAFKKVVALKADHDAKKIDTTENTEND